MAVKLGTGLTTKFTVDVLLHPNELPLTVYNVVTVGLTTVLDPVAAPGVQV